MGKRFICTQGLLSFRTVPAVVISNLADGESVDILDLPLCKREEIYEFAMSYTDKLLVTEGNGRTWVISASVFPSSSLCAVFGFDISPSVLYRLARECGAEDMLELSRYCELGTVRISKALRARAIAFGDFCKEIRACFYDMDRLKRCESERAQCEVLTEHCHRLSLLCGCPVELKIGEGDFTDTDLPLLTAFLLTMLISARKNAKDRCARISIESKASASLVSVSFDSDISLCISKEMLEWRSIAADRCMAFLPAESDGNVEVEFHPCRYDLAAIFRIKQGDSPFFKENPYE